MSQLFENLIKEAACGESHSKKKSETAQAKSHTKKAGARKPNPILVKAAELILGGKGDFEPTHNFSMQQLAQGIAVEMEHTNDFDVALEIAKDHLMEFPDYYDRLEDMEEEAKEDMEEDSES